MSKVEIKLNTEGIRQLRHSEELEDFMTECANDIKSKCKGSYEVSKPYKGKYHSNVEVKTASQGTYYQNLKNNELLKAVGSSRK